MVSMDLINIHTMWIIALFVQMTPTAATFNVIAFLLNWCRYKAPTIIMKHDIDGLCGK